MKIKHTRLGKTKEVKATPFNIPEGEDHDLVLFIDREEDGYALFSPQYKDKKVAIIYRSDWDEAEEIKGSMDQKTKADKFLSDHKNEVLYTGSNRFYGEGDDFDYVIPENLLPLIHYGPIDPPEEDYIVESADKELITTIRIGKINLIFVTNKGMLQWRYAQEKFMELIKIKHFHDLTKKHKDLRVLIFSRYRDELK